jgi:hypothetical protein
MTARFLGSVAGKQPFNPQAPSAGLFHPRGLPECDEKATATTVG